MTNSTDQDSSACGLHRATETRSRSCSTLVPRPGSWALDDDIVGTVIELPTTQEPVDAGSAEGSGDLEEALDDGVDVTLIRWMLSLSPEQRLEVLQSFLDSIAELTGAQTSG